MPRVLITGCCGFIGTCLALRLQKSGVEVLGIDNLSRSGSEVNARELESHGVKMMRVDIAAGSELFDAWKAIGEVDAVFHLAAQVAVTWSYNDPVQDFRDNAIGSFNVIEGARRFSPNAYCLYASTNKVFGNIAVLEPVGVDQPLDPYTPYGVSKAVGDLYFREYARPGLDLTTNVLRQSCIYGHHQYGVEDQGWVAWFTVANRLKIPITIFGDGKQVRDLLWIDDLIDLYLECWNRRVEGVYPVGGGAANSTDLLTVLQQIVSESGEDFAGVDSRDPRLGDQPYFVADLGWLEGSGLTWRPKIGVNEGVSRLVAWVADHEEQIREVVKR
jgi:CDP-paratose 2-epimerase